MRLTTARVAKALTLLSRPQFARAALRHQIAAAVEHMSVIRHTAAATLVDIGANKGQFSLAFRALRPKARIIAFEPMPEAADQYERLFKGDERVKLHRHALADYEGEAEFHLTNRRDSSSLLRPTDDALEEFGVHFDATIRVPVRRLDSTFSMSTMKRPILMKLDVQGGELAVLAACADLEEADFIYAELSYVPLYESQPLYDEIAGDLRRRGFGLRGVFNQTHTKRFGPTQADFLFTRRDAEGRPSSPG